MAAQELKPIGTTDVGIAALQARREAEAAKVTEIALLTDWINSIVEANHALQERLATHVEGELWKWAVVPNGSTSFNEPHPGVIFGFNKSSHLPFIRLVTRNADSSRDGFGYYSVPQATSNTDHYARAQELVEARLEEIKQEDLRQIASSQSVQALKLVK